MKRRAFLGLGLAVVLLGPEAVARADADDWERIAQAWSYEITTAPDRSALLPGLLSDLKRLRANGGPQRTIAQLSSHVAMIAVSSGDIELARRWFRRAQVAASASGDTHLQANVMGLHAVEGVFGMHAPARVLALATRRWRSRTRLASGAREPSALVSGHWRCRDASARHATP